MQTRLILLLWINKDFVPHTKLKNLIWKQNLFGRGKCIEYHASYVISVLNIMRHMSFHDMCHTMPCSPGAVTRMLKKFLSGRKRPRPKTEGKRKRYKSFVLALCQAEFA